MFYSLTGKIVYIDVSSVAVECAGIAFSLTASANTLRELGKIGDTITLYTYLQVREDGVELFGFFNKEELAYFKMLLGVSGIGPKAAIAILSTFTPDTLSVCITAEDVKSITRAQGIGSKTAQRLIVELKDKVAKLVPSEMKAKNTDIGSSALGADLGEQAIDALISLGYSRSEATAAVCKCDMSKGVESIIKQALANLMKG